MPILRQSSVQKSLLPSKHEESPPPGPHLTLRAASPLTFPDLLPSTRRVKEFQALRCPTLDTCLDVPSFSIWNILTHISPPVPLSPLPSSRLQVISLCPTRHNDAASPPTAVLSSSPVRLPTKEEKRNSVHVAPALGHPGLLAILEKKRNQLRLQGSVAATCGSMTQLRRRVSTPPAPTGPTAF